MGAGPAPGPGPGPGPGSGRVRVRLRALSHGARSLPVPARSTACLAAQLSAGELTGRAGRALAQRRSAAVLGAAWSCPPAARARPAAGGQDPAQEGQRDAAAEEGQRDALNAGAAMTLLSSLSPSQCAPVYHMANVT